MLQNVTPKPYKASKDLDDRELDTQACASHHHTATGSYRKQKNERVSHDTLSHLLSK